MPDVNEHADVTEKRKAVLQSLEAAVTAREHWNLVERISLITSEVKKAGDGELTAAAEALGTHYEKLVIQEFLDLVRAIAN